MNHTVTIADALFGKTQQRVLGLLYGKPDEYFHANEIVRRACSGKGSVMRELETLRAAGLLTCESRGNQTLYQANHQSPVYTELAGLVRKTFGMADVIRHALSPMAATIGWAFIYGSIAKNEATSTSDIDLMLVGENLQYSAVMELLAAAEKDLGRTINPTLYTPQDLAGKIAAGNAFVVRVLEQPKINVIGQEPEKGEPQG
jgi:predicted nucleotidyltransferase